MQPEPLLSLQDAEFVQGGVSVIAAARTGDLAPMVARALGCRVASDRREVTLFLSQTTAAGVLSCLRESGAIAVVFSQPSTHQTLQLKGDDARILPLDPEDLPLIQGYRRRFAEDLGKIGYTPAFADAVVAMMPDLVGVRFTPSAAFQQTPGPDAGKRLRS